MKPNQINQDAAARKFAQLKERLTGLGSLAVAFSSGVDSTFLLKAAHEALGGQVLAITAKSSSFAAALSSGVMVIRFAFDQLVPLVILTPMFRFVVSSIIVWESCTHSSDPQP